jgi:hypothetical protein
MKKAFTLVVLIVTPTMAFAQGTVAFNNQTGLVTSYPALPKSGGSVELIAAPQGTPLPNPLGTYVWQDLRPYFIPNYSSLSCFLAANPGWEPGTALTGGSNPGLLAVGGIFNNGGLSLNVAEGANAYYIVIGWSGSWTSYDVAFAGGALLGQSGVFTTTTGDPLLTPPSLAVNLKNTFGGLVLAGVPESKTFALAGLGLAALLVCRRRR